VVAVAVVEPTRVVAGIAKRVVETVAVVQVHGVIARPSETVVEVVRLVVSNGVIVLTAPKRILYEGG
jgi:hypothetical protein